MQKALATRQVELAPGGFHFGGDTERISTLLGSCVAITLWHPRAHIGGMCHFLVPSRSGSESPGEPRPSGRFADEAMDMFCDEIARVCTTPRDYQAKIFGGGNQFPTLASQGIDVPERNIAAGLELLSRHGFSVSGSDLGRSGPRRIVLELATGVVWVRHSEAPLEAARP